MKNKIFIVIILTLIFFVSTTCQTKKSYAPKKPKRKHCNDCPRFSQLNETDTLFVL